MGTQPPAHTHPHTPTHICTEIKNLNIFPAEWSANVLGSWQLRLTNFQRQIKTSKFKICANVFFVKQRQKEFILQQTNEAK